MTVARIPFNRPHLTGAEFDNIRKAIDLGHLAGGGHFTRACEELLQDRLGIDNVLMTCSGTAALELAMMLCDIGPGDEVILPSFTFVSTATAIARTGATPRFVDIRPDTFNIDPKKVEQAIGPRTRAIIPVHYAGVGCDLETLHRMAAPGGITIVEDAAHAVNAFLGDRPLGGIGQLGCFSFHETKNYIAGEGGALCVNDPTLLDRARIIRDKGTDRYRFDEGLVDKYTWVDTGSSFAASDLVCAFLKAQLDQMDSLLEKRLAIHARYQEVMDDLEREELARLPRIPADARHNAHGFFLLLPDRETRDGLIAHLEEANIGSAFHYVPLHSSPMGRRLGCDDTPLPVTDAVSDRLLRMPMHYELGPTDIDRVADEVGRYLRARGTSWVPLP
ncbi:MAG: dTDP-4-amino-4,6-dideoxygalactose transaminase [bacterium]|nr:dTDP-4-amino-4,6-dideoxygalactose transaminase [bacterium]